MTTFDAAERDLGLRERKNRRTRREIVRAAAELTIEGGWASATIPRIAERADVAPRTVSTWFPAKDDIVFAGVDDTIARAVAVMRTGTGDVVDRVRAFLEAEVAHHPASDPEVARLRRAAIEHDLELRARDHQHFARLQAEIADAVARQIGGEPTDMGPQVFAGATTGFFWRIRSVAREDEPQGVGAMFEEGYALLRATLEAVASAAR